MSDDDLIERISDILCNDGDTKEALRAVLAVVREQEAAGLRADIERLNKLVTQRTEMAQRSFDRAEEAEREAAGLRLDLELLFSRTNVVELYNMLYPHYVIGTGIDGVRAALAAFRAGGGQ